MNIFLAILALSFLIIVHEFGHFIVAKLAGIKVLEFSLFMGPKLWGFKKGETNYTLRAVPLGGYVKMEGEEIASDDERAYNRKPVLVRAAVIAAGPVMNLIVAVLLIFIVFSATGFNTTMITALNTDSPAYQAGVRENDVLVEYNGKALYHYNDIDILAYLSKTDPVELKIERDGEIFTKRVTPQRQRYILGFNSVSENGIESNLVNEVVKDGPAAKAGLTVNDRIIRLNGTAVNSKKEIADFMRNNKDNPVKITVLRGENEIQLSELKPEIVQNPEYVALGIQGFEFRKGNIGETIKNSFVFSYSIARTVYYSLTALITGKVSLDQMMGPLGIVDTIGTVVEQSPTFMDKLTGLMSFAALISINLGLFNLIPFPALDGSKLILLGIEAIRRKALPPEKEAYISLVGLVLLVMLMIFVTYNDILRIGGWG